MADLDVRANIVGDAAQVVGDTRRVIDPASIVVGMIGGTTTAKTLVLGPLPEQTRRLPARRAGGPRQ